ncbi:MAG: DUF2779 domain-containing protein [Lentimicrobium sp.]|nr:DUF2779 domain-containing protein [Lentimicrobium sp.]
MPEDKHTLSKSTYVRGMQCLKSLYLHKNRPFLRDRISAEQLAKFRRGHEVGALAHELFPGGINCAPGHPSQYQKAVEKTRKLLDEKCPVIYEAAFEYDGVLIFLDILTFSEGIWNAYEVKSSLRVSEVFITDAALQYYVLNGSGLEISDFFLVHMNGGYIRQGEIVPREMFVFSKVTEEVQRRLEITKENISLANEALTLKKSPPIEPGNQCFAPYPCDFMGHCWKNLSENSIYRIGGITKERRLRLMSSISDDISQTEPSLLSAEEKMLIEVHQRGTTHVDPELRNSLQNIDSAAFASLLLIKPAVPLFEGTKPFQTIAAGISLFSEKTGNHTFIAPPGSDPRAYISDFLRNHVHPGETLIVSSADEAEVCKSLVSDAAPGCAILDLGSALKTGKIYKKGIDTDYDFLQNLSSFLPGYKPSKISGAVMAGVNYLNAKADDEAKVLTESQKYLEDTNLGVRKLFEFLVSG